jgi:hypothetical protein
MAILIQLTCVILLLGTVHNWLLPIAFERRLPLTYVHTSIDGDSSSSSLFNEMNRMMSGMHERFEHMFNWPSFPMDDHNDDYYDLMDNEDRLNPLDNLMINENKLHVVDDSIDIQKKLDAVQPVCTTTTVDASPAASTRKSRRKKLRSTQITTCVKELIVNGQKHFYEEINTVDDKGVLVKQSKSYGTISVDTDGNKAVINTDS